MFLISIDFSEISTLRNASFLMTGIFVPLDNKLNFSHELLFIKNAINEVILFLIEN